MAKRSVTDRSLLAGVSPAVRTATRVARPVNPRTLPPVLGIMIFLVVPTGGRGSCLSTTFESQVHRAQMIFAGTVTRSECVRVPGSILTRYTFVDLAYAKGSGPADSLVLTAEGGTVGNEQIMNSVEQYFDVGRRHVVFVREEWPAPAGTLRSMVCGTGHPFWVIPDSTSGVAAIHVGPRHPIVHLDSTHIVLLLGRPWSGAVDDTPLRELKFDSTGEPVRVPPPSSPLEEIIRMREPEANRQLYDITGRETPHPAQIRWIWIWPHQDPGTRVEEAEFLDWLRMVVRRVASDSTLVK